MQVNNLYPLQRALFMDRDGVINVDKGYVYQIADCQFISAIFKLARAAKKRRYQLIIVTNQSGIARGFFSLQQYYILRDYIHCYFAKHHCVIDAEYYCPYHKNGLGVYQQDSYDRKPQPGMLLKAAKERHLDLAHSILIGDKISDIEAGKRAGVGTRFLVNQHTINFVGRFLGWY